MDGGRDPKSRDRLTRRRGIWSLCTASDSSWSIREQRDSNLFSLLFFFFWSDRYTEFPAATTAAASWPCPAHYWRRDGSTQDAICRRRSPLRVGVLVLVLVLPFVITTNCRHTGSAGSQGNQVPTSHSQVLGRSCRASLAPLVTSHSPTSWWRRFVLGSRVLFLFVFSSVFSVFRVFVGFLHSIGSEALKLTQLLIYFYCSRGTGRGLRRVAGKMSWHFPLVSAAIQIEKEGENPGKNNANLRSHLNAWNFRISEIFDQSARSEPRSALVSQRIESL